MPEPIASWPSHVDVQVSRSASVTVEIPRANCSLTIKRPGSTDFSPAPLKRDMGLTSAEAALRQSVWGLNDVTMGPRGGRVMLPRGKEGVSLFLRSLLLSTREALRGSMVAKYIEQFRNPLILLLLCSAAVSLLLGQLENCVSITLVSNAE